MSGNMWCFSVLMDSKDVEVSHICPQSAHTSDHASWLTATGQSPPMTRLVVGTESGHNAPDSERTPRVDSYELWRGHPLTRRDVQCPRFKIA